MVEGFFTLEILPIGYIEAYGSGGSKGTYRAREVGFSYTGPKRAFWEALCAGWSDHLPHQGAVLGQR